MKNKKDIKYGNVELDPDEFLPQNVKVRITTFVDQDILDKLKEIAEEKKVKYQTLLNSVLRSFVEQQQPLGKTSLDEVSIRRIVREEIKKTGN